VKKSVFWGDTCVVSKEFSGVSEMFTACHQTMEAVRVSRDDVHFLEDHTAKVAEDSRFHNRHRWSNGSALVIGSKRHVFRPRTMDCKGDKNL
jgi:hypothetical protein